MSYIRGALPFLIYNPNTRDDIVPDGVNSTFELSQEVPGGYENNVQVIRREFKSDLLIQSCSFISFDGVTSQISCDVPAIAAALSVINVGDILKVEGAANLANNGEFLVSGVSYDGETTLITLDSGLITEAAGSSVTLNKKSTGPWEILEPEIDYVIGGTGAQINKLITFSKIPQETDAIYVVHRGEATYNFVPTEKTVGPEQLQDNLRNFQVDVFTGDGSLKDFTLSQVAVNAKTLEVSVDGVLKYGSDPDILFVGDFELINDGTVISFVTAPTNGAKIYVRHLGFSTVSRRQSLSPSQIGALAPSSVGTIQLALNAVTSNRINDGAVTTNKIQNNAVNGAKILFENNESLNWKSATSPFGATSVLKLDSSNSTILRSPSSSLSLSVNNTKTFSFQTNAFFDSTATGEVSLGTASNKFADAHLSGALNAASLNIQGDAAINGNLSINGTVDSVDVSALQAQVNALADLVLQSNPAGTIKLWAKDTGAPTGYVLCDGASYSTLLYTELFAAIGYTFGGSGGVFNVPDFRGRFPLGKSVSGTGSGWGTGPLARNGELDHTHSTPAHTHGLANHVHFIASHHHAIIASNSTLSISPSGNHTTSIAHDHLPFNTLSSEGTHTHTVATGNLTISLESSHTHGVSDIAIPSSQGSHSHSWGNVTDYQLGIHSHTGTTNTSGSHNHDLSATSGTDVVDGTSQRAFSASNTSFSHTRSTSTDGAHSHPFSTSSVDLYHRHSVSGTISNSGEHGHTVPSHNTSSNSGHTHTISGTVPNTSSTHVHTIDVPAFPQSGQSANSVSDGNHTHASSAFSGSIGNVSTGADGNAGFNSGPPSPNNTDSGGASTTGASNPAFQTINFIIKT